VQDPEGEGKIVYLFLPLYKVCCSFPNPQVRIYIPLLQNGNLQDAINANVINSTHFPEQDMVRLFKGTCLAIRAMHDYRAPVSQPQTSSSDSASRPNPPPPQEGHEDEDDDDERFPHAEGDGEGGYSYGPAANVPLMTKRRPQDSDEVVFDGDEELSKIQHHNGSAENGDAGVKTEPVPYAHRDMKPGYVDDRNVLEIGYSNSV
jgi:serine/threonine kinase 16